MLVEQAVLLLEAGHDAFDREVEVVHADMGGVVARGQNGRLVDQVGEVGAREAGREGGDGLGLGVGGKAELPQVQLQDLHARLLVGPIDEDLAIEAPCAQQRRVQDLGPVRGCQQYDTLAGIEAVELREELVQGLLLLVVAAGHGPHAAGAAHRVQLVDEDDARRPPARLLEQVADAGGADAHEHLHELAAADGEERNARLPGDGPGQ